MIICATYKMKLENHTKKDNGDIPNKYDVQKVITIKVKNYCNISLNIKHIASPHFTAI